MGRKDDKWAIWYPAYLQSADWLARRSEAIKLAGYRCRLCNSDKRPLHVHHRTYARVGAEDQADLTVLCAKCHKALHEWRGRVDQGRKVGTTGRAEKAEARRRLNTARAQARQREAAEAKISGAEQARRRADEVRQIGVFLRKRGAGKV